MGRHGIRGKDRKKNKKPNGFPRNYELVAHDRTSEAFVKFYQAQGIIPPEEWDAFIAALKRELPSSFRLVGCKKEADVLRDILNTRYISQLEGVKVEEEEIEPPKPLPWYPNNLAYQMKMSRTVIRKNTILNKLHNFLVTETELGNISRQETVSMIPPLLLDVEPHHKVFDMCAAPGSKTMQLIEMLHSAGDSQAVPEGFVLANDVDNTRCYLLVHQALKRMPTPCALVVNHDATSMPRIRIDEAESANSAKFLTFDRVLCDVVCSGDGTLRKNPDLWRKWNPNLGNGVHKTQFKIAKRGMEMLAVGGRMIYSTCSLNPIEDEAILIELLDYARGSVELVDVSDRLTDLKRTPGVSQWKVFDKDMTCYEKYEDVPEALRHKITPTMFPPPPEKAAGYNLHRSFRILPHHQDTGAFFVAVLHKTADFPWAKSASTAEDGETERAYKVPPAKKMKVIFKEDPFVFLPADDPRWHELQEHYGLDETFPHQQLLGRTTEADNRRSLYFVNAAIKRVLQLNKDSLKVINAGLRVFGRVEAKFTQCRFRLSQDGAPLLMPYMNKSRSLRVSPEDMYKVLISTQGQGQNCPCSELSVADQLESIDTGSVAMWTEIDGHRMVMCTWRGKNTVSPYISKEQRIHMIRVLGYEATELEEEMTSRRKQKAAKDREENTPKGAPKELTTSQLSSEIDEALDKIEAQYHTVQTVPDTISHGVEDEPSKSSVD